MTTTKSPEQLTLLPEAAVPVQFRLDEATRRRGLAHVAEIRAQLDRARAEKTERAERSRGRGDRAPVRDLPVRRAKSHAA